MARRCWSGLYLVGAMVFPEHDTKGEFDELRDFTRSIRLQMRDTALSEKGETVW